MGDRGNIVINENYGGGQVYLYTHWSGYNLPQIVATALEHGEDRWDDDSYLARVLFCELIREDIDGTTGYGISTSIGDGGTEIYVTPGRPGKVVYDDNEYTFDAFIDKFKVKDVDHD